ncbi:MAG: glutamyl-tRNA reductase [Clostridiales bacterium]|nr:glutamyl-tRNA reductase [Clostridiales bacterium]
MHCISISCRKADVDIREKLSFSEDEQGEFIKDNMVILSTCCRTEFYFSDCDINKTAREICSFKSFPYDEFKKYVKIYSGDGAILNLCRVACGLESKILGEDEILGQVKEAFYAALEKVSLSYEIKTVFKGAITAAKKIKTETLMSKSSVSIGTLTAAFVHSKGFKNVLIIGISGKTGSIVAKDLLSYGDINITATIREHNADYVNISNVNYIPFKDRYKYMKENDIIISVTASPHYTVTSGEVLRYGIKNKIFIDLAVPRDIDEDISDNEIYNIDYFEAVSKKNCEIKIREKDKANLIISEMIDSLKKEMYFHSLLGELSSLNKYSFEQLVYKVRDGFTAAEFEKFIMILRN